MNVFQIVRPDIVRMFFCFWKEESPRPDILVIVEHVGYTIIPRNGPVTICMYVSSIKIVLSRRWERAPPRSCSSHDSSSILQSDGDFLFANMLTSVQNKTTSKYNNTVKIMFLVYGVLLSTPGRSAYAPSERSSSTSDACTHYLHSNCLLAID